MTAVHGYSVLVQARSDGTGELHEDAGLAFATAVAAHHGVAGWRDGEPETWEARISVDADGPVAAGAMAADIVARAAAAAGLPAWPITRVDVVREDLLDTAEPARWPELVSGPEVAEILGVTPQRVHQLATENAKFPKPAYHLRCGKIWIRAAITSFARDWDRRPGNRSKKDVA